MEQKYFLGLDIGTGSVGWAVTDKNYNILRKHGKSLWGVRLFESASTAEDRRLYRTSRRRLDRRNRRLQLLQELFAEEINNIDPGFFLRMKESTYLPEDKRDANGHVPELPYALFIDEDFTDKDYHKQYPTIYHLRKMLMETSDTPDIRLVYLAFHHIMKHRGHFLLSGNIENIKEFKLSFNKLLQLIREEELDFDINVTDDMIQEIELLLKNKDYSRSRKKTELTRIMGAKNRCSKAICSLLTGYTVNLCDLYDDDQLKECEKPKISFTDSKYDEYIASVEDTLEERFIIIEAAKAVYDWATLVNILGEASSISEAKVSIYEKHAKDLVILKELAKNSLSTKEYKELFVFSDTKFKNYPAYVGMSKINGKKIALQGKKASKEDFYDFLKKKILTKIPDSETKDYILEEIEKETFLPKSTSKDNGVLPHQVHLYELKKILENLSDKISILNMHKEKIIQLFEFRIPYYVGPLNVVTNDESKFTWAVRRTNEKISPWNFDQVIDVEKSAEKFIRRMTNKCTYLKGADVLPKDSLLYSKFMVLNELNNLRINGEPITVVLKQDIFEEVFKKKRKVTQKKLKEYLAVNKGYNPKTIEFTGIDGDFKASLNSYHDFKEKLTDVDLNNHEKEQIILNIVLFGDDTKLLNKRLQGLFPQLTAKQIKSLSSLKYKGWGRLSKEFLQEISAPAPETGEEWNIITALWETNDNLMQLLSHKYLFHQNLQELNKDGQTTKLTYQTVDDLYVSPAVKRQIWQAITIVKEIQKVMGAAPERIFIEMAREKQESKRTVTRQEHLMSLYQKCKEEERNWITELNDKSNQELRSDRLYLYYTQKGRCMYSGKKINFDDLWIDQKYDIDHIYPQSKIMDDSIDNRVLVKHQLNQIKDDNYPISSDIRTKQHAFWKSLCDGEFISKEKYKRLTRSDALDSHELAGFIQRQLVETRQSTKAVAELLKNALPDTEIVYSKAKVVSKFRKDFEFIKVRDMNDLHHAKDAYLNIVVGNTYFIKFTKNPSLFIQENPGRSYNLQKMFKKHTVKNNTEVAWTPGDSGSIATVRKFMNKNDILVTRKAYEVKGELFDQQIMKKGKGQVPIKSSNERLNGEDGINKYGGYNKAKGTYFMLVESTDKKGKQIRSIVYIPLYLKTKIENDEEWTLEYLKKDRGLINPKILIKKIKTDTLFEVDGFKMWLSGRSCDRLKSGQLSERLIFKNANQLVLSEQGTITLKKALKYVQRLKDTKDLKLTVWDELSEKELIELYNEFLYKLEHTLYGCRLSAQAITLANKKELFCSLPNENKCIVLSEILHMFQCNSVAANLSSINGPSSAGILIMNNNITTCESIVIINNSPSGIYEKRINLLKI